MQNADLVCPVSASVWLIHCLYSSTGLVLICRDWSSTTVVTRGFNSSRSAPWPRAFLHKHNRVQQLAQRAKSHVPTQTTQQGSTARAVRERPRAFLHRRRMCHIYYKCSPLANRHTAAHTQPEALGSWVVRVHRSESVSLLFTLKSAEWVEVY